ncbi:MAG: hypothetical protein J6584_05755 [Lactobacillus sp.]|uniref:Uncharacterized protein n=1 Tax=Bombilactobacillus bombi TaxID=1303590 RepID=A0A347SSZ2_9LACO|nr:LVIS_2131 family protein [Bombilactobacillus bombi]AXX65151.1 hypothetical protein DS830_06530 [Bombilactobacillus bombi]MCO6541191.1 hypothetical protein [Lactobacillus sp.]MCO6543451.1 hypothetical protein [Lactobacillus sp.]RHW48837.1 hypothetical protein DS832_00145 [Bombilactobacillus bombi]
MHLNWNLLGLAVWLIIIVAIVAVIFNIRKRHLKMIVVHKKRHSLSNSLLDIIEVGAILLAIGTMFYLTFLNKVSVKDTQRVYLTYEVKPLVMQTKDAQGFYVQAKEAQGKNIMQYYTYWVKGARFTVPGNNASISDGHQPISLNAKNYPWPHTEKYDKKYQYAYVMTMIARYKNNVTNGLGLHAGNVATDYSLIRVPSSTFVNIIK